MEYQIRPLRRDDDRSHFQCGQDELDYFFRKYAGQNQFRHHIGVTYIATDGQNIYGYVTLAMGSIEVTDLPTGGKLPRYYPLPVLRLGRLAVDSRYKGKGVGRQLLRYAFLIAVRQKNTAGCVGVVLDAKAEAVDFYRRYGFQTVEGPLEGNLRCFPQPTLMFLPIKSIPG